MLQYRQTNLPALLVRFNERVWPNSSYQELGTEQRQANMLQYLQNIQEPWSVPKCSARTGVESDIVWDLLMNEPNNSLLKLVFFFLQNKIFSVHICWCLHF